MTKSYLVTGGTGFLGSALVRRLVRGGCRVRVFDNNCRGHLGRLAGLNGQIEFFEGDIRDPQAVRNAMKDMDAVWHLAFINGTEFFYSFPELVLEVGIKGIMNVVDGCLAAGVRELIVASSSEVYQEPPVVPTGEDVPLCIPNVLNPRYSYASGKLISEMVAINYGRAHFDRMLIFRPHNVYGPDMGWEHVIPQFVVRMKQAMKQTGGVVPFPIQGNGEQTRAFVFIDDFIDGLMLMEEKGEHLGIYHVGTTEEVSIGVLARMIGEYFGRTVELIPSEAAPGGTPRRCPDIRKIAALGYAPKWPLRAGLEVTVRWYDQNSEKAPANSLNREDPRWKIAAV